MASKPSAAVKNAIRDYQPAANFRLRPPLPNETSVIFDWGVRIEYIQEDRGYIGWICLADDACRQTGEFAFVLSAGRTSKATKHLRTAHNVISVKTTTEINHRRKREEDIEYYRASTLYKTNPRRFRLLVEATRIINNNLPLRFGESAESKIIESLIVCEDMRSTINAENISESIIELYVSEKNEIASSLYENRTANCGSFTMMTDFWSCPRTNDKYLGLRVYYVDQSWQLKSVFT